jgi:hypothetical protein
MSDPIVIGRVTDPQDLDLEPLSITLCGYTLEHEEVSETFRFRPTVPTGAALEIIRHTGPDGNVPVGIVLDYVDKCLLEADQAPFRAFLDRDDVMIQGNALVDLYQSLLELYSARPTRRPSGSASTSPLAKRTSRAAARSAASKSKSSRSSSASTSSTP